MADSVELRMSVTSIKRVDPYVKQILATSTHVALYKFNPTANEWEKTDTEGALFLYSRNGVPYHSIMIMNRLNTNNLIEPIVKEFEYQMQAPFLLYRNSKSKIFGIWFYNREECVNITFLLESLTEGLKEKMTEKTTKKDNSVDIFSMLTKAQEDFNKTPNKADTQPPFSSTPASTKTSKQAPVTPGDGENLLQRLMSNPAHSVEHIEKQQRSITPQEQIQMRQKTNSQGDRRSVPISFTNASTDRKSENGINLIGVSSPQQTAAGTSPLAAFLMQSQSHIPDENEILGTSPLAQLLETPQKPSLMPPMMFATSSSKDKNDLYIQNSSDRLQNIEPLTKNQMLQALTYLIKHDADFVTKLHEAYVKSITDIVNHSSNPLL
ncbi:transcription factor smif decapping enzyme dcp1 [Holotrichia oblita]|uniref:Transcription factor smif decapping enzyme dcp1 n=2 Tax=Holotrichia oblita TaxID=644536 RepID=A0ACB9T375_HOLOL|nr:transcription factor smif decapping enzyme dcp1 [Holotrichia oblita]KAI4461274.1 transcription factor smif decapping enzyme dcp1 [Holotrichia oblita]